MPLVQILPSWALLPDGSGVWNSCRTKATQTTIVRRPAQGQSCSDHRPRLIQSDKFCQDPADTRVILIGLLGVASAEVSQLAFTASTCPCCRQVIKAALLQNPHYLPRGISLALQANSGRGPNLARASTECSVYLRLSVRRRGAGSSRQTPSRNCYSGQRARIIRNMLHFQNHVSNKWFIAD